MMIDQIHFALPFTIIDDLHVMFIFLELIILPDLKRRVMNHEVLSVTLEIGWVTD